MKTAIVFSALLLTPGLGCLTPRVQRAAFEARVNAWVGRPIKEFRSTYQYWASTRPTQDGGVEYTFEMSLHPGWRGQNCLVIYTTNAAGLILRARHEGTDCYLETASDRIHRRERVYP